MRANTHASHQGHEVGRLFEEDLVEELGGLIEGSSGEEEGGCDVKGENERMDENGDGGCCDEAEQQGKRKRKVSSARLNGIVSTELTLDIVPDLDFSSSSPFSTFKKHLGGVPVIVFGQRRALGVGILGLGVRRVGRVVEDSAAFKSRGVVQM